MNDNFFQNALSLSLGKGLFEVADKDGATLGPPPPPGSNYLITEDGNYLLTESGNNYVTE